jgi:hypothetical protein
VNAAQGATPAQTSTPTDWAAWLRRLIFAVLTVLAFGPSLSHIHQAAVDFGQIGWMAWATAASVDLLAVHSGLVLRDRHRAGQRRWDALLILSVTVVITIAAQVVTAQKTPGGIITAVWPAACFLAVMALAEFAPDRRRPGATARAQRPVSSKPKPQVKPATSAGAAPSPAPAPPAPVTPVVALVPGTGEDRVTVVSGWLTDGVGYMAAVRAAVARWGVSESTAKRLISEARETGPAEAVS